MKNKVIKFPQHKITKPNWYMRYKNINKRNLVKILGRSIPTILALILVIYILFKINYGI